ncbi:MAG: FYDLN acid domain-containing protein [Thermoanaerobaculia bacterium]
MAATVELGTKHECPSCGTKYYDLGKSEAPCPKCGSSQEGEEADADKKSAKS